jgi:hypothetical protein
MNDEQEQDKARGAWLRAARKQTRTAWVMAGKDRNERRARLEELECADGRRLYPWEREAYEECVRHMALTQGTEEAEKLRRELLPTLRRTRRGKKRKPR